MGRAVLLIHGFLSDENDFTSILPSLQHYYQKVLIVKIPGHGKELGIVPFDVDGCFNAVISAFDSLKDYHPIDVIGYSMGGCLAAYLAGIREFNRLVLLAPAHKYLNIKYPFKRMAIYRKLHRKMRNDKENAHVYFERINHLKGDYEFRNQMIRDRMHYFKHLPKYYLAFRRIIRKINREITEITNPCLIVWGNMDEVVPRRSIDYIKKLCTNQDVSVVEFADHSHLLLLSPTNSAEIITTIMEFLREKE